jgi:hypothetical protein
LGELPGSPVFTTLVEGDDRGAFGYGGEQEFSLLLLTFVWGTTPAPVSIPGFDDSKGEDALGALEEGSTPQTGIFGFEPTNGDYDDFQRRRLSLRILRVLPQAIGAEVRPATVPPSRRDDARPP